MYQVFVRNDTGKQQRLIEDTIDMLSGGRKSIQIDQYSKISAFCQDLDSKYSDLGDSGEFYLVVES